MKNYSNADIYQQVTDTIIEMLTNHINLNFTASWINVAGGFPHNPASKTIYNGLNQLLLSYAFSKNKYAKNAWLTFIQVQQLKATIKKGSKSTIIVFNDYLYFDAKGRKVKYEDVQKMTAEQKKEIKKVYFLKHYKVFNVAQVENLPAEFYTVPEVENLSAFEKDERAEELINGTGAKIHYVVGNRAFYSPIADEITLPVREQFTGAEPFYRTAFHEIAHWTGHETRLNRDIHNRFGNEKYAKEELVAELTSAFLSASLGFEETITSNAAYIQNWLTALQNDKRFIVIASSSATKAAEYIIKISKQSAIAA